MAPILDINSKDFERAKKILELSKVNYNIPVDKSSINVYKQVAELDTKDWIAFPDEFLDGKYVNWSMSPERLSVNSAIETVGKTLDYNLRNTSKDSMNRDFIGNINHEESLKINLLLGQKTPSIEQGIDLLYLLDEGAKGNISVYNNAGKKLKQNYLAKVRDDIIKVQSPWRAEWFEDKFTKEDGKLKINNDYVVAESGILIPRNSEFLDNETFMQDTRISLESLFKTKTNQGLPTPKTKSGNLYYWSPVEGSVAWFDAVDRANLICNGRIQSFRISELGVRAAQQRE